MVYIYVYIYVIQKIFFLPCSLCIYTRMYCTTCSYGTVSWELCLSVIFCSLKYNNWKWKLNWEKERGTCGMTVIVPEELWYNLLSPALFTLRVFSLHSCNSIKKSVIAPEELWYNLLSPALFTLRVFFYHQTSTNVVFTFMQFNKEIYFPEVSKCNVIQRYQTGKIKMFIKICFTQRCSNV